MFLVLVCIVPVPNNHFNGFISTILWGSLGEGPFIFRELGGVLIITLGELESKHILLGI